MNVFTYDSQNFEIDVNQYLFEIDGLKLQIKRILNDIFALKLPTFKKNNLHRLEVVKSSLPFVMPKKIEQNTDLLDLWERIFLQFQSQFKYVVIGQRVSYVNEKVDDLKEYLKKYKDSLQIDPEFLM